jgi:hypothetical protein
MLVEKPRIRLEDFHFDSDVSGDQFDSHIFVRLAAVKITFENVRFRYCTFDACYLRGCVFVSCDFTGCHFISTSFHSSTFSKCLFNYATFEKTVISDEILTRESPVYENQKEKFARSLRVNYQQLGEANSANKAIRVELQATKTHLFNAWFSDGSYYREKYAGLTRLKYFFNWLWFSALDFLWGNGESPIKLLRSVLLCFVAMAVYDAFQAGDPGRVQSYFHGFFRAPEVFLGTRTSTHYSYCYLTVVLASRLLAFGALLSILFKRFNRR